MVQHTVQHIEIFVKFIQTLPDSNNRQQYIQQKYIKSQLQLHREYDTDYNNVPQKNNRIHL